MLAEVIALTAPKRGAPLCMVVPTGASLDGRSQEMIEAAWMFAAAGQPDMARAEIRTAEFRLGITDTTRRQAYGAIPQARQASRDQRHSRHIERTKAKELIWAVDAAWTDGDKSNVARADALLEDASTLANEARLLTVSVPGWVPGRQDRQAATTKRRAAKDLQDQAKRILNPLERSRRARAESIWAERVIAEIASLEMVRGDAAKIVEEVIGIMVDGNGDVSYVTGHPLRLDSRDGISALFAREKLDLVQVIALRRYRELYEATDPQKNLRPPPIDPSDRKTGGGGEGWADKRHRLWTARKAIEAKVSTLESRRQSMMFGGARTILTIPGSHAVFVLHEVAGKGHRIGHFASGRAHEADTLLLAQAADILASHYGLTKTPDVEAETPRDTPS